MDISWILLIIILILVFAGMSVVAVLRRIAEATERSADQLEKLVPTFNRGILP